MPTHKYDRDFQFHAEPKGWDWRRLKAQGIAESNLDRDAVSQAGAMGVAQFMPATWVWLWRQVLHFDDVIPSPFEPSASIEAQAIYMGILLLQFGSWPKAWAAYNAGPGRLQRIIDEHGPNWEEHLPAETRSYLGRIERIETKLKEQLLI